jgi:hypothetical protein
VSLAADVGSLASLVAAADATAPPEDRTRFACGSEEDVAAAVPASPSPSPERFLREGEGAEDDDEVVSTA